jgi:hypothetical protein
MFALSFDVAYCPADALENENGEGRLVTEPLIWLTDPE